MKLFFDTETTGKANMKAGPSDPSHPHIVQLAALLTEDDGLERAGINFVIKPDGYEIPKEASDIHGITTEIATACGVPLFSALSAFNNLCCCADMLVAHNIDFDLLVSKAAFWRINKAARITTMDVFCTMKASTKLCRLPGPYGYKWPKLSEAYLHFTGTELVGAHDALADVRACARVFFAIRQLATPAELPQ